MKQAEKENRKVRHGLFLLLKRNPMDEMLEKEEMR